MCFYFLQELRITTSIFKETHKKIKSSDVIRNKKISDNKERSNVRKCDETSF